MTVTAYGASMGPTRVWPFNDISIVDSTALSYAKIQTTLGAGAPVERFALANGVAKGVEDAIYFDGQVKFTAFDSDPADPSADEKIALWLRDLSDDETSPAAETNLMVRVGQNVYNCGNDMVTVDKWTHLTIKAIKMTDTQLGFVIFIDGDAITLDNIAGIPTEGLTPAAAAYAAKDQLFPSAVVGSVDALTITAVAFDGQGAIDDVCFTDKALKATPASYTVLFGDNVENVTVTANGATVYDIDGGKFIVFASDVLTPVTASWTGKGNFMDGTNVDITPTATGASKNLSENLAEALAKFNTSKFATVQDAVDAANDAAEAGTITLLAEAGDIEINKAGTVLDLNGTNVTGSINATGFASIVLSNGVAGVVAAVDGAYLSIGGSIVSQNIKFDYTANDDGWGTCLIDGTSIPDDWKFVADDAQQWWEIKAYAPDGDGSEAKPFLIKVVKDLEWVRDQVAAGTDFAGKYFQQRAEIDLTDIVWEGIGTYDEEGSADNRLFCGIYDGNEQTIKNVTYAKKEYNGLFGNLGGEAQVKDLTITVAGIAAEGETQYGFGGAVGYAMGTDVLVENVTVNPAVTGLESIQGTHNMGGIGARLAGKITLRNCVNNLDISTTYSKIGGICAIASQRDAVGAIVFDGCVNNGTITGVGITKDSNEAGSDGLAGILGYIQDGSTTDPKAGNKSVSFINCVNNGTLQHTGTAGTTKACIASFLGKAGGQTYVDVSGNTAKADYLAVANGTAPDGLFFATVENGVATFVQNADLEAGKTYKVMAAGAEPTIELAADASITFDTTLGKALKSDEGITAADDENYYIAKSEGVYTCTEKATPDVVVTINPNTEEYVADMQFPIPTVTVDGEPSALTGTWDEQSIVAPAAGATNEYTYTVNVAKTDTTKAAQGSAKYYVYTPAAPVVPVPVEGDLEPAGEANAIAVAEKIAAAGGDVNTWVETVYGKDGKIPAGKLNATTPEIIALAVANDLPITENVPTFAVEAAEAEDGVAAFTFTLMDGATPEQINALTEKVKAMVKYTGDLDVAFDAATEDEISVELDEGAIKAELKKQDDVNAGFMKVEPNQPK